MTGQEFQTEEELEALTSTVNNMHVSLVSDIVVSLASTREGVKLILVFNSCCGLLAFDCGIETIDYLVTGLLGAKATLEQRNKGLN